MTTHLITNTKGHVLFQAYGYDLFKLALERAVKDGVQLTGAKLSDIDLYDVDLYGAKLQEADLSNSNAFDADLENANLSGANLSGVDFTNANLRGANLSGANLTGTIMRGANITDVNFTGTNLCDADLGDIKADFFDVLIHAPNEINGLRKAIVEGRISGSMYRGLCACLIGTIANIRETSPWALHTLIPDMHRPVERWFLGFSIGDTPQNSQVSSITLEWLDQFISMNS